MSFRLRVVVGIPEVNESRLLSSWLEADGYETVQHSTAKGASEEIASQPFDLLVAHSSFLLLGGLRGFGRARFAETPVIVLGDATSGRHCAAFGSQIMFVETPVDRTTFICMVTLALMDARPERRSVRRTVSPFEAVVNGARAYIIDVSREGVRIELPQDCRMVTPQFVLRVPMIGVGVTVERMWTRSPRADEDINVMWCGGQLVRNTTVAEQ